MKPEPIFLLLLTLVGVGCATSHAPSVPPTDEPPIPLIESAPARPAPPTPPRAPEPSFELRDAEAYRPPWWIDLPAHSAGRLIVAASGRGDDLLDARRAAVRAGREALRDTLAREPADAVTDRTSAIRLSDGTYLAFVLMSARE